MDCLGIELYLQKNYITVVLDDSDDCVYVEAGETYFRQNCCFSIRVSVHPNAEATVVVPTTYTELCLGQNSSWDGQFVVREGGVIVWESDGHVSAAHAEVFYSQRAGAESGTPTPKSKLLTKSVAEKAMRDEDSMQ